MVTYAIAHLETNQARSEAAAPCSHSLSIRWPMSLNSGLRQVRTNIFGRRRIAVRDAFQNCPGPGPARAALREGPHHIRMPESFGCAFPLRSAQLSAINVRSFFEILIGVGGG